MFKSLSPKDGQGCEAEIIAAGDQEGWLRHTWKLLLVLIELVAIFVLGYEHACFCITYSDCQLRRGRKNSNHLGSPIY